VHRRILMNVLLNSTQLASALGVSVSTICRWIERGLPVAKTLGGKNRFDLEDVRGWLRAEREDCEEEDEEEEDQDDDGDDVNEEDADDDASDSEDEDDEPEEDDEEEDEDDED
jgi:excisionase family DNA binding protein